MKVENHVMKRKGFDSQKGKEVKKDRFFVGLCVLCYWTSWFCFLEFMLPLNLI